MSRFIDERIVKMGFDNKAFESNVRDSMNTIDKLKSSLNFSGVSNSVNKSMGSIDTSVLTGSLSTASNGFSAMEVVAITAISNITNRVIDLGIQMAKSLSTDNIAAGWQKFGEKTNAVGTLIAQGFNMISDEGTKNGIEDQLAKLSWFTDETSYNFTTMVDSIGKFTASGQGLEESVTSMMGIATWAAQSGQNAETASRAMYTLSQAMGAGKVGLYHWRSIQNANMDTKEFREQAMEAAFELGVLQKGMDGIYTTSKGNDFTSDTFTEFLTSDDWLTDKVLMKTLEKYAAAVDEIYDVVQDDDSINTTAQAMEKYGPVFDEFGLKAFRSAQEARTFKDAIDSVKDAVGSGWMNTFESIFGDYNEAKKLWTDVADELYDVFVEPLNMRNEVLKAWKDLGGRDDLFARTEDESGAFWNLFDAIVAIRDVIKNAWRTVFPFSKYEEEGEYVDDVAGKLKSFTERFKAFTERLILSEESAEKLGKIFKGVFSVLKIGVKIIQAVITGLKPLIDVIRSTGGYLFGFFADLGERLFGFTETTDIFVKAGNAMAKVMQKIIDVISSVVSSLLKFVRTNSVIQTIVKSISDAFTRLFEVIKGAFNHFTKVDSSGLDEFNDDVVKKFNPLTAVLTGLGKLFEGLWAVLKAVAPVIGQMFTYIGNIIGYLGEKLKQLFTGGDGLFKIERLIDVAFWTGVTISLYKLIDVFSSIREAIVDVIGDFGAMFDAKAMSLYAEAFKTMSVGILILVAALVLLASVDQDKMTGALISLTAIMGIMIGLMNALKKMTDVSGKFGIKALISAKSMMMTAESLTAMAIAIGILALSLKLLSTMSTSQMVTGIGALSAVVLILVKASEYISKNNKQLSKGTKGLIKMAVAVILLSKPVKSLSKLSVGELAKGIGAVTLLTGLALAFSVLGSKINKSNKAAKGLITFSTALWIMSIPVRKLGKMSWEQWARGLAGVLIMTGIMAGMGAVSKYMNKSLSVAFSMQTMGMALLAASFPVKILGKMSWEQWARGLAGITAITIIFAGLGFFANKMRGATKTAFAMQLMGNALLSFSIAMKIISTMSWESLGKSAATMAGIIATLAVVGKLISTSAIAKIGLLSIALTLLGIGLISLSLGLRAIGSIKIGTLVKSLLVLGGALVVFGLIAMKLSVAVPVLLGMAAAVALFGVGLLAAALAVGIFISTISLFVSVGVKSLDTLLKAIIFLIPNLVKAIGMIIITLVNVLVEAVPSLMTLLSAIINGLVDILIADGPRLIQTLVMLISVLIASLANHFPEIAKNLVKMILALMDTLTEYVVDITDKLVTLFLGLLRALVDQVPRILADLREMFSILITALVDHIRESIPMLVGAMFDLLIALIDGLGQAIEDNALKIREAMERFAGHLWQAFKNFWGIQSPSTKMFEAAGHLIQGLIDGLWSALTGILSALWDIGSAIFGKIWEGMKNVWNSVKEWTIGAANSVGEFFSNTYEKAKQAGSKVINGVKSGLESAWNGVKTVTSNIANGVVSVFKEPVGTLKTAGTNLINSVKTGISNAASSIKTAAKNVANGVVSAVKDPVGTMKTVGTNLMDGLKNGINSAKDAVVNTTKKVADSVISGFKGLFGIKSPSRVFMEIGEYLDLGLAKGISDNSDKVYKSTKDMGDHASEGIKRSGLSGVMEDLVDTLNGEIDDTIVLTPVLDLSEIQNGTNSLHNMMDDIDNFDISGTNNRANRTYDSITTGNKLEKQARDSINNNDSSINTVNNTFNITGSNPREIADEVSKVLQKQVNRSNAKWAT